MRVNDPCITVQYHTSYRFRSRSMINRLTINPQMARILWFHQFHIGSSSYGKHIKNVQLLTRREVFGAATEYSATIIVKPYPNRLKNAIVYIRIEMQLSYGVYVSSSFPINQTFWGQTSTSLIINKIFSVSSYDVLRIIACTCGVEVMCFPHRDGTSFPEKLN